MGFLGCWFSFLAGIRRACASGATKYMVLLGGPAPSGAPFPASVTVCRCPRSSGSSVRAPLRYPLSIRQSHPCMEESLPLKCGIAFVAVPVIPAVSFSCTAGQSPDPVRPLARSAQVTPRGASSKDGLAAGALQVSFPIARTLERRFWKLSAIGGGQRSGEYWVSKLHPRRRIPPLHP